MEKGSPGEKPTGTMWCLSLAFTHLFSIETRQIRRNENIIFKPINDAEMFIYEAKNCVCIIHLYHSPN